MSLETIHLRKLLQIFDATAAGRRKIVRSDARASVNKESQTRDEDDGGGDFHSAFWADAKEHARGNLDLRLRTKARIEDNKARRRLYPLLEIGFLTWWNEKRRWRNEPFEPIPDKVFARFRANGLGTVKVENVLSFKVGGKTNRIVYPYFSEAPTLTAETARLGLWIMSQALTAYAADEFRVLDVLRSTSFAIADVPFIGNEQKLFLEKYEAALREWNTYRDEFRG